MNRAGDWFLFVCLFFEVNMSSRLYCLHNKTKYEAWKWITWSFLLSPPNSKCLHLWIASILLDLQLGSTLSSLRTIFVVLAFLQKILSVCHHNHSASCHNAALPAHTENPYPFRTVSRCGCGACHISYRKSRRFQ